jgi:protein-tyrosine phosphatase
MIDLHSHVLPGIDDGAATIESSVAMARAAAAAGTRTIVATPHVSWTYPNRAETITTLSRELAERLRAEQVSLEIVSGAEIALTRAGDIDHTEFSSLALGDSSWLLLEPPFTAVVAGLDATIMDLRSKGFQILLAHPERCPAFQREPSMLNSLVRSGVLTSITAGSLVGRFGGVVRRFAFEMISQGLVHNVASDAHDCLWRPPGVRAELESAGLGSLGEWLTNEVPAAILGDDPIPPRPAFQMPRAKRSLAFWSRRR